MPARPPHTQAMSFVRAQAAALTLALLAASPAAACATALILAIDVSNSIDDGEYRIQTDGLADALDDPAIREELVRARSRSASSSGPA
jgi:hypothetical protein